MNMQEGCSNCMLQVYEDISKDCILRKFLLVNEKKSIILKVKKVSKFSM